MALVTNWGPVPKTESDKGQDKPTIWDGNMFKLVIVLKNFYTCIEMEKKSKCVTLTYLVILMGTFTDPDRQPIEGEKIKGPMVGLITSIDTSLWQGMGRYPVHVRHLVKYWQPVFLQTPDVVTQKGTPYSFIVAIKWWQYIPKRNPDKLHEQITLACDGPGVQEETSRP